MGSIASQITSLTIVHPIVYSDAHQKVTGEFPAQMASNAENTSIWWGHHEYVFLVVYWSVLEVWST